MEDNAILLDAKELDMDRTSRMHQAINDMLKHLVEEKHEDNIRLRQRVVELEVALNLEPLFTPRIAIKGCEENLEDILGKFVKAKGAQEFIYREQNTVASNKEDMIIVVRLLGTIE